MTTFVLVHGAWHGGWCYKRVARLLRQAGHEVYTPTLTGLGERAHLMNPTIDLDTHVQDIVGVIRCEELSDVVLCAHSYGCVSFSPAKPLERGSPSGHQGPWHQSGCRGLGAGVRHAGGRCRPCPPRTLAAALIAAA